MLTMNHAPAMSVDTTHTTVASKLGDLTVVARRGTVVGLYFPHHWYRPDLASFGPYSDAGFDIVRQQIGEYLAGERREFEVPMATSGDAYQERVWSMVRQIPYGETATYGDLARQAGRRDDRSGGGRGRRPEPSVHPGPMPSGRRRRGEADRLCRRSGPQAVPPRSGGRGRGAGSPPLLRRALTFRRGTTSTYL